MRWGHKDKMARGIAFPLVAFGGHRRNRQPVYNLSTRSILRFAVEHHFHTSPNTDPIPEIATRMSGMLEHCTFRGGEEAGHIMTSPLDSVVVIH